MVYELCSNDSLVCRVANLLFDESKDFWLGYHSHEDILVIIDSVLDGVHDIAETLLEEVKKLIPVEDSFDIDEHEDVEREWMLLSLIGDPRRRLDYEQFVNKYTVHKPILESLFRLSLVGVLSLIEQASLYLEEDKDKNFKLQGEDDEPDDNSEV